MKNLLAATAALALFASSSKDSDVITDVKGGVVKVSFAEAWEKNLSSVTMFVFDATGDLITQRSFNASELAAKTATFALPGVSPGERLQFLCGGQPFGYIRKHSFATVLKRKGASIAFISESLGHTSLNTTQSYLDSFEKEERIKNAALLNLYLSIRTLNPADISVSIIEVCRMPSQKISLRSSINIKPTHRNLIRYFSSMKTKKMN